MDYYEKIMLMVQLNGHELVMQQMKRLDSLRSNDNMLRPKTNDFQKLRKTGLVEL